MLASIAQMKRLKLNSPMPLKEVKSHGMPSRLIVNMICMIVFGVQHSHFLDDMFGVDHKTVMADRDVPGLPRSMIPVMRDMGVTGWPKCVFPHIRITKR